MFRDGYIHGFLRAVDQYVKNEEQRIYECSIYIHAIDATISQ